MAIATIQRAPLGAEFIRLHWDLARREDRLQALMAGFQAHVTKPVKLAELVCIIDSIVQMYPQEQP